MVDEETDLARKQEIVELKESLETLQKLNKSMTHKLERLKNPSSAAYQDSITRSQLYLTLVEQSNSLVQEM
jgi:hypothetical protein